METNWGKHVMEKEENKKKRLPSVYDLTLGKTGVCRVTDLEHSERIKMSKKGGWIGLILKFFAIIKPYT